MLPSAVMGFLPTPTAHPENRASPEWGYPTLRDAVNLLPTLRAQDEYERRNMKTMVRIRDEGGDMTLPTWAKVVAVLLPTPRAQNGEDVNNQPYHRWYQGKQMLSNLENRIALVIDPTMEVLRCSGAITAPPSHDGNASSDDPHPHQLSLDGQGIPA
jgi:hypothetical protein